MTHVPYWLHSDLSWQAGHAGFVLECVSDPLQVPSSVDRSADTPKVWCTLGPVNLSNTTLTIAEAYFSRHNAPKPFGGCALLGPGGKPTVFPNFLTVFKGWAPRKGKEGREE